MTKTQQVSMTETSCFQNVGFFNGTIDIGLCFQPTTIQDQLDKTLTRSMVPFSCFLCVYCLKPHVQHNDPKTSMSCKSTASSGPLIKGASDGSLELSSADAMLYTRFLVPVGLSRCQSLRKAKVMAAWVPGRKGCNEHHDRPEEGLLWDS